MSDVHFIVDSSVPVPALRLSGRRDDEEFPRYFVGAFAVAASALEVDHDPPARVGDHVNLMHRAHWDVLGSIDDVLSSRTILHSNHAPSLIGYLWRITRCAASKSSADTTLPPARPVSATQPWRYFS